MVAQDLAQLYFWGDAKLSADLAKAYHFALLSQQHGRWPHALRLLRSAFVLLAMDRSFSPNEAVRQFQREINSGEALRRDKALAVLNQVADLRPRMFATKNAIYGNARLREPLPVAMSAVVLVSGQDRLRLLIADANGAPQLAWTQGAGDPLVSLRETGSGPLFFQRRPTARASGAQDSRQQLWRLPPSSPTTGILISRFRQRDGSFHESRCTASQLNSHWLLSAAHCLYAADGSQFLLSLHYIATPPLSSAADEVAIPVSEAWQHKDHRAEDQQAGNVGRYSGSDIALYRLKRPAGTELNTPVLLAAPTLLQGDSWVESFAYPSDKTRNSLWASRCSATLWQRGELSLSDVYALNCYSYPGQSGAALLQKNVEKPGAPPQIVGVLSSRISNDEINQPVFAALNSRLIADIHHLIASQNSEVTEFEAVAVGLSLAVSP